MAISKRVKIGGSFYKGYLLTIGAPVGDYALDMVFSGVGCAVNGISIIPASYGAGDYFKLEHLTAASGGTQVSLLAETVYNVGAGVAIEFDFSSLELVSDGHTVRLTYSNVAGVAMNVYTILERIR